MLDAAQPLIAPLKVAVVGGGSFGTVLANISATRGNKTFLWLRDEKQAQQINTTHRNQKYIPQLTLHCDLHATTNLQEAVADSQLLIIAVPSKSFAEVLQNISPYINQQFIVTATKGIARDSFQLMSQLLEKVIQDKGLNPEQHIGVLSGPNIANEIANKHLTGSVIATHNHLLSAMVRQAISTKYLHIFENDDVYGVELAGALKNIYAIAAGISDSLGFGINTKSVLITRSAAEMARFAVQMNANHLTFLGLAGIGDLITTCFSPQSRNYRLGNALIGGKSIDEICDQLGGVAEGIHTTKMAHQQAIKMGVNMPLLEGVYRIIFNGERVKHVLWGVLRNTPREDVEYLTTYQHNK